MFMFRMWNVLFLGLINIARMLRFRVSLKCSSCSYFLPEFCYFSLSLGGCWRCLVLKIKVCFIEHSYHIEALCGRFCHRNCMLFFM